jgi:hypothetical protein
MDDARAGSVLLPLASLLCLISVLFFQFFCWGQEYLLQLIMTDPFIFLYRKKLQASF